MKTIKKIFLLTFTLALISASCEKEKENPVCDTEPAFSCKVNGVEWVAETPFAVGGAVPLHVSYYEPTGELYLTATKEIKNSDIFQSMKLSTIMYEVGSYSMTPVDGNGDEILGFHDIHGVSPCKAFYRDSLNSGNLTITKFDKIARLISGTFNMTLINHDGCLDSIMVITDGKFSSGY